ncbi:MAG: aminoglycoside phosphotransferase family protein [Anaerolineae bacterium]|jgi:Ser/Thr protein kinase RdoA (MazF antagonist)
MLDQMKEPSVLGNLADIAGRFRLEGDLIGAAPLMSGHINDTYVICCHEQSGAARRYLLQRINHHVFWHPQQLMENIERVTAHLRHRIRAAGGEPERETLTLIPTKTGGTWFKSKDSAYWRAEVFIEGARTYKVPQNLDQIYQAGQAFGRFQRWLSDYPVENLHETIPDFHHTLKRYEALQAAIARDPANRARQTRDEIAFVEQRAGETTVLVDLRAAGRLPNRATHNDTKFDNVLIDDETGAGLCVIDLDTVMPGSALYDFGDAARSMVNPAAEDERHLDKVALRLDAFERLVKGFLDATRAHLTPLEIELLPFSAKLMTLECGIRFLTDFINGDAYFRIQRANQNLDRCRTQFKLVQEMEQHAGEMQRIVRQAY